MQPILIIALVCILLLAFFRIWQIRYQSYVHIRESYNFMQRLLDSIPNPVFYNDVSGVFLGCNSAFASYVGKDKRDIIGKTAVEFTGRDMADGYTGIDQFSFSNSTTQVQEARVAHTDGTIRDVMVYRSTYTDGRDAVAGLVGVIHDVTDVKLAQQQLLRVQKGLAHSEKLAAIGQLAAGIAHEINNPLGFIKSNVSTLKKYLERIKAFYDETSADRRVFAVAAELTRFRAGGHGLRSCCRQSCEKELCKS